jgi:hypothetical protein
MYLYQGDALKMKHTGLSGVFQKTEESSNSTRWQDKMAHKDSYLFAKTLIFFERINQ